jgi:sarcosine oxidase subunit beta
VDFNSSAGSGSTAYSSSIVRVFYSALDSCKLAWESYHGWQHWGDYLQAPPDELLAKYRQTGGLILDSGLDDVYVTRVRNAMEKIGIEYEEWDLSELERRVPYISTESYSPPKRMDDDTFGQGNGRKLTGGLYVSI